MKVGFAVQRDEGLESKVYNHFGSAPMFVVVETGAAEVQTIHNQDLNHSHGACSPMKALGGQQIDSLVVGGIGAGVLMRLNSMGVNVYAAEARGAIFSLATCSVRCLISSALDPTFSPRSHRI
jgi:predicted Fe-Mo cluster-binding NifX family protein